MDVPVKLANRSDLYHILDFLETGGFLPYYCEVHSIVLAALLTQNPCYKVYILRNSPSERNKNNETYRAIVGVKKENASDNQSASWMLTDWSADDKALVKVYDSIKKIDWKRDAIHIKGSKSLSPVPELLAYLRDRHEMTEDRFKFNSVYRYHIDIPAALKISIKTREDVYVKSLERCHAGIVHSHWTAFNQTSSVEDVADEIDQLPSAGVFLKETDELVCWINCHLGFGMARLYTLEEHRRRGYATLAIRYLAKRMAQSGYIPVIAGLIDNPVSKNLFQSLTGFQFLKPANGFQITPFAVEL